MQLQDLSYKLNNAHIPVKDEANHLFYEASLEIVSLENVYTIPSFKKEAGKYDSNSIVWGNDVEVEGHASISMDKVQEGVSFSMKARLEKPIRSLKIRFDGLPLGTLINSVDEDKEIDEKGLCLSYPEGWRSLSWPMLVFKINEGKYLYVYCKDKTVTKRTFFLKKENGSLRIDVVEEQDGTLLDNEYSAPEVIVGVTNDLNRFYQSVSDYTKKIYGLDDYEESKIAPSWLKDIHLVVTMHMEAFTGKIFHTYRSALEEIKKITHYIEGKHILVYLAGWEGRYYYKYGNYCPDERLGGADELKRSIKGMHELGCKVMLMYGMNMVNKTIPGLEEIVKEGEFVTIGGGRFHQGSVNWEGAHHYDFDDLAQLNIGNKAWADCLFTQIKDNSLTFDADGAFLDIAACYVNDRHHRVYEGVVDFCDRLRTIKKDFLVSGEGYYDGLSRAMPLFQSGHTDGKMHYHNRVSDVLFTRFSREFAHLCLGDPSIGSTGVHEQGINEEKETPFSKAIIPTLSLVDGSIENGQEEYLRIIEEAKKYGRVYGETTDE